MSLSSAISNSLSGLIATARATEVVSTNISNKSVAGYARRELDLSSRIHAANGGGVSVDGVTRVVNAGLIAENRISQAHTARSGTLASFHATMETSFGMANDSSSLVSMLTALDAALVSASANPDNDSTLRQVLDAATDLSAKINSISRTIEESRSRADSAISNDVDSMNASLERVSSLNRQITTLSSQGHDVSSLIDARQAEIDSISNIVPLVEVTRENGQIALFTQGGATLLDGTTPSRLEFTSAGRVTADMSIENGALSTITLNGKALSQTEMSVFLGGSLSANFEIRDRTAPAYQGQIDGFAREVYQRFADPSVDPTLASGEHGLFADGLGDLTPANELGLASRIAVSAAMDPEQGGALWRIRAGRNATASGDAGETRLILNMSAALSDTRSPTSASLSATPRSMLTLASDLASNAATSRIRADAARAQDQTRADSLKTALLSEGVDTDTEMEALLTLEKAYAANAKVLQAANDMLDELLRMT